MEKVKTELNTLIFKQVDDSNSKKCEEKKFACDLCEKVYKTKGGLNNHMEKHDNVVQVDGNVSLVDDKHESTFSDESAVDESDKMNENSSLSRLMELTKSINSQLISDEKSTWKFV